MSRGNLRKNRKNLSLPYVATVNVNDADHVHRLPCELPALIGGPRHEDDEPMLRLIEVQHLDGITLGMNPIGVSGGVGGGVEENFKMHSKLQKTKRKNVTLLA